MVVLQNGARGRSTKTVSEILQDTEHSTRCRTAAPLLVISHSPAQRHVAACKCNRLSPKVL